MTEDDREGESLAGNGRLKYSYVRSGGFVLDTRADVVAEERNLVKRGRALPLSKGSQGKGIG